MDDAEEMQAHHHGKNSHQRWDQRRNLAVDLSQKPAQTSKKDKGTNDATAKGQAALPRGTTIFKAG